MYQAYLGRVCKGQPMISDDITLPENANVIITVLDELPFVGESVKTTDALFDDKQAHRVAFEEFFTAMSEINDEPLDGVFDAILANRVNIKRELDL